VPLSEADRTLAVAIPVPDDDDDGLQPRAIAYEYHSATAQGGKGLYTVKGVHYRQQRFIRLAVFLTVVVVMLTVGITLLVLLTTTDTMGHHRSSSNVVETTTSNDIQTAIQGMVGTHSSSWSSSSSPYDQALQWILYDDPLAMTSANATLLQRYLAAYVYFATSTVNHPWKWCNPPGKTNATAAHKDTNQTSSSSSSDSCTFWQLFVSYFNYDNYKPQTASQWLSNTSECQWAGISCDVHGQIVDLDLSGFNLTGTFPEGVFYFPFLQKLSFRNNSLHGALPSMLSETMPTLRYLDLRYNDFTGSVPAGTWNARKLNRLDLGGNQLAGSIPPDVGSLSDMKNIFLNDNMFTGVLPPAVGSLNSVISFSVNGNHLGGTIPSSLANWSLVFLLWLNTNQLTGQIPSFIGKWTDTLDDLRLQDNAFHGTIPEQIFQLTLLQYLDLSQNSLSGTLSSYVGNFSSISMDSILLNQNRLSGTIPPSMGNLTALTLIELQGNAFTGSVPTSLCNLPLRNQPHFAIIADCSKNQKTGAVQVQCDCCTACCEVGGTKCASTQLGLI